LHEVAQNTLLHARAEITVGSLTNARCAASGQNRCPDLPVKVPALRSGAERGTFIYRRPSSLAVAARYTIPLDKQSLTIQIALISLKRSGEAKDEVLSGFSSEGASARRFPPRGVVCIEPGRHKSAPLQFDSLRPCVCAMASISKTDYVLWRACPKNAWLRIHKPELYCSTELTEYEQSITDMGIEVERVARNLFPHGVVVAGTEIEAQENALKCLASNSRTLFQAVFERDQLLAAIDVLQLDGETSSYSIQEIKSSTDVKEEHLYDLAFQVVLLRQHGMPIRRACIVHLNPGYVRQGDLDIQQLFTTVDITTRVDQISGDVIKEIQEARAYLLNEAEPVGPCSCIYKARSKHCTTFEYSNPDVPRYGVHDIARIGSSPKKLKELVDAGILVLDDMPLDIKLTSAQNAQLRAHRTGETVIEKEAIAKELGDLTFPLHFIDYETFAPAIPLFAQYSPYDQIPLQYSVHIVGSPGEELIHRDFLHIGSSDPSTSFLSSLQQHVGPFGSIIVWNKGFESHVNDCIARRLPGAKDYVIEFNDRLYDLMDIFAKQYFVHKDLCGKVSIKNVLPVLTPHLSYSSLRIHDGAAASLAWSKLISDQLNDEETARLYAQLREYCALDSYGMYAIWQALISLVKD
jgi:Domain of unknown function(DUF2779)